MKTFLILMLSLAATSFAADGQETILMQPCTDVHTAALRVMTENHFVPMVTDKESGVYTFFPGVPMRAPLQSKQAIALLSQFVILPKTRFPHFRFTQIQITATSLYLDSSKDGGCKATLKITYAGLENESYGWQVAESSGGYETRLLSAIRTRAESK